MTTNIPFKACFPGKYIQSERALNHLPELISLFGNKALIIASPTVKSKVLPKYEFINSSGNIEIELFNGECSTKEIARICSIIENEKVNVLIGIGGGKLIDTVKIAGDKCNVPIIICPTIASTDAPCSGCAVIYTDEGIFESVYYQKVNPQIVLVDVSVIAAAPSRYLVAGMGDALATWFEARSCYRSNSVNECGGYSTLSGMNLAKLCYDTVITYGEQAKMACENNIITPALHKVIEANTLLSGIGFESAGLAAAHSIHNGLTAIPETHAFYHGEKVAFGVLAGLYLTGAEPDEIKSVFNFCKKIGLPTNLFGIGIIDNSYKTIMRIAEKACASNESIHKEAVVINPISVFNAIAAADSIEV